MRLLARVVVAGAMAGGLASCGLITGLGSFSNGDAPDGSLPVYAGDVASSIRQDATSQASTDAAGDDGASGQVSGESDGAGPTSDAGDDQGDEGGEGTADGSVDEGGTGTTPDAGNGGGTEASTREAGGTCVTPNTTTNCGTCGVACSTSTGTPSCNGTTCSCSGAASAASTVAASTAPDSDGCETTTSPTNQVRPHLQHGDRDALVRRGGDVLHVCLLGWQIRLQRRNGTGHRRVRVHRHGVLRNRQTAHSNGESGTYYDCSALNTHSQNEAQAACEAYTGGTCSQS